MSLLISSSLCDITSYSSVNVVFNFSFVTYFIQFASWFLRYFFTSSWSRFSIAVYIVSLSKFIFLKCSFLPFIKAEPHAYVIIDKSDDNLKNLRNIIMFSKFFKLSSLLTYNCNFFVELGIYISFEDFIYILCSSERAISVKQKN